VGKYIPMYIPVCMCINVYLAFYLHLLLSLIFSCSSQSSTPTRCLHCSSKIKLTSPGPGEQLPQIGSIVRDSKELMHYQLTLACNNCTPTFPIFFNYYFLFGCFCLYFVFTVRRLHEKPILFGCSPFSVHFQYMNKLIIIIIIRYLATIRLRT